MGETKKLAVLGLQGIVVKCTAAMFFNRGPHKLCDRLYFEFIEAMYGNIENPRIIVLDCDRMGSKIHTCHCLTSSNQKEAISGTVGWHV